MLERRMLEILKEYDTNVISDCLDYLELDGAVPGVIPLWGHPKTVGICSTIEVMRKTDDVEGIHGFTHVIDSAEPDSVFVVVGAPGGVSCWGDIVSHAALKKGARGTIIDGCARDTAGCEAVGYPVYGTGVTMVSARNRLVTKSAGEPIIFRGIEVCPGDYVIADRCGVVFIPASRITEVLDLAAELEKKQAEMVARIAAGGSSKEAMHDREFSKVASVLK
jgi:4-hydroxy-4-methyl-2-oxoglutarate aldolase